jgi:hypothetical protein
MTKFMMTNFNSRGLLSTFPVFAKPSYEAFIHKKLEPDDAERYDIAVAIPSGKRAFLWFTMSGAKEICCIVEIGRNHTLQDNIHVLDWECPHSFSLGTLLSGYLLDGDELCPNHKYFVADDIFAFKGYEFGNPFPIPFDRKFEAYTEFFRTIHKTVTSQEKDQRFSIHSIVMWNRSESDDCLPLEWSFKIGYKLKHIQYRSSKWVLPFANVVVSKNPWECGGPQIMDDAIDYVPKSTVWSDITTKYRKEMKRWDVNFFAPVHSRNTLFWVSADITWDMYYLFVQNDVLFQHAFIPNSKTSMMMNGIFRHIVENECLDKVEESEDEEDFENIRDDKYVDLEKRVLMECVFHQKFKKWVPVIAVDPNLRKRVPRIDDFLYHPSSSSSSSSSPIKYNDNRNNNNGPRPKFTQPSKYVPFHRGGRTTTATTQRPNEKYQKKSY